ncbi:MAG: hypothetical protein JWN96_154 [Mycobacterium sp.]|nr:hypothetical protein [Mycobacterium sp.]
MHRISSCQGECREQVNAMIDRFLELAGVYGGHTGTERTERGT